MIVHETENSSETNYHKLGYLIAYWPINHYKESKNYSSCYLHLLNKEIKK